MKKILAVLSIFIIIFLTLLVISIPRIYKISEISCESQYGPCENKLNEEIKKNEGKSYLAVRKNIKKILSENKEVSKYTIRFFFPSKLFVALIERKPVVAVKKKNDFYLIDKEGMIIEKTKKVSLPQINLNNYEADLNVGSLAPSEIIFASKISQKIYSIYNVNLVNVSQNEFTFTLSDGKKVIFPLKGDIEVLLGSLAILLSKLNSENNYSVGSIYQTPFVIIDLRYKNPVLR